MHLTNKVGIFKTKTKPINVFTVIRVKLYLRWLKTHYLPLKKGGGGSIF